MQQLVVGTSHLWLNKLLQVSCAELVVHACGYCRKLSVTSRLSEGDEKSSAILISPVGKSYNMCCKPTQDSRVQSRTLETVADAQTLILLFT